MTNLNLRIDGIADGERIPEEFAFGIRTTNEPFTFGANVSPAMHWDAGPKDTKSFAVIMHDRTVPTVFDDANQEGKTIPANLARMDFMHWVLVDIAASTTSLPKGAESSAVVAKGKATGPSKYGVRGANDFGMFMASNPEMAGNYGGYDGPAPPWNDEIMHEYVFTVYALDVESLGLNGVFSGSDALAATVGHVLASGQVVGNYTLNPALI
ncbi:MAG: YbhB/YbcL family Raf kinase inhibitor-like protein [Alphaproteobacteria bacterium]|nr:YbhB/YbcL family Raf kinase inhibitor-like protein [Alphaproteobacteria bacterium]